MDFDPQHPKWICCCCHLTQGLMILGSSEIVLSILLLLYSIAYIAILDPEEQYGHVPWFAAISMPISIMYGVTSALLIFGIHKYKDKLMYPTLIARTIIVIFIQVFGVSIIAKPSHNHFTIDDVYWNESDYEKVHESLTKKKTQKSSTANERLVILIFIMLLISIFVFYTLYSVVRCIRYVKAYKRLLDRKRSLLLACNTNPANKRRSSRASGNLQT
ncbi:unnamed protein product [Cercopithifilaria johnstoni]|uniref:DUF7027 domain-containing protein n=1 Tax=Cercopithifilaria johnstoni TaxID=2874296 RepID=A0A8J2PYN7_9BILA|nr:unnamed protein product [Cercopithifilaria johnstoni]